MFTKKIEATYQGEHFVVINNWFSGIKVYHNGELVAEKNVMIARDKYVPYTSFTVDGSSGELILRYENAESMWIEKVKYASKENLRIVNQQGKEYSYKRFEKFNFK